MSLKQIGRFNATDSEGRTHRVYILQMFSQVATRAGVDEVPGQKMLQLADGSAVNRKGKGQYEIVETGMELMSDDPAAI